MKIALIVTTFLRPKLFQHAISAILEDEAIFTTFDYILVGDQISGRNICEISAFSPSDRKLIYFNLPFDYGLSASRNYLVEMAYALGADYCLISADSIMLDSDILKILDVVSFLAEREEYAIVGFNLRGRIPWEYKIDLRDGTFKLSSATELISYGGIAYRPCDICRNFFVAKTKALLEVKWDENLKLCEHEDFFWRMKQAKYEVFYTDYISASYMNDKPEEYVRYRNRMYGEFREKLMRKYNLSKWIEHVGERTCQTSI